MNRYVDPTEQLVTEMVVRDHTGSRSRERRSKLYGMEEYLVVMHEVQKARLNRQTPKVDQKAGCCQPPDKEQAKTEGEEVASCRVTQKEHSDSTPCSC